MADNYDNVITVSNLNSLVKEDLLTNLFEAYGPIASIKFNGEHTVATIVYQNPQSAREAMSSNGTRIGQCVISIKHGNPYSSTTSNQTSTAQFVEIAQDILSHPEGERMALLFECKKNWDETQQSEFLNVYSKLQNKAQAQARFIKAIEEAGQPGFQEEPDELEEEKHHHHHHHHRHDDRSRSRRDDDRYRRDDSRSRRDDSRRRRDDSRHRRDDSRHRRDDDRYRRDDSRHRRDDDRYRR